MLHPQKSFTVGQKSILFNSTTTNYGYGVLNARHNSDIATTFLALIRPTGSGEGGFGYIAAKTIVGSSTGMRFFVDHNAGSPRLAAGYASGNAGPQRSAPVGSITYGRWVWVAYTFVPGLLASNIAILQGENSVQEVSSYSVSTDGTGTFSTDATNNFHIGNRDGADRTFAGDIALVVRWNTALSRAGINEAIRRGPSTYQRDRQLFCWVAGLDIGPSANRASSVAGVAFGRSIPYRIATFDKGPWPFAPAGGGAQTITLSGIASEEAFGSLTVAPGGVTVAPSGIASAEAFGDAIISAGGAFILPSGIASAEAFGSHSVLPGAVSIVCSGIASAEAFGDALVSAGGSIISTTGIASAEAFGSGAVLPGGVTLLLSGIASAEAFGATTIAVGGQFVQPLAIDSAEAFGAPMVNVGSVTIICSGIASGEAFGSFVVTGGVVTQLEGLLMYVIPKQSRIYTVQ